MLLKKRLSKRGEEGPAGCRQTRLRIAHHVRRRSALWPDEPPATVLGSRWDEAAGRLSARSRIRLFVWRRQPEGRHLRLSDHAGVRENLQELRPQVHGGG